MKYAWTKWRGSPPDPSIDVIGWWGVKPEDQTGHEYRGRSCKRGGCCFHDEMTKELLIPPTWWRAAHREGASHE